MRLPRGFVSFTLILSMGVMFGQYARVAQAQSLGEDSLVTLRGLKVGSACDSLQPAMEQLQTEGFRLKPVPLRCATGGDFRSEVFLRWRDGMTEELYLFFTPENTLWRVKTMTQWSRGPATMTRPTVPQLTASLERRFGKPKTVSGPGADGKSNAWQYQATWETVSSPDVWEKLCKSVGRDCPKTGATVQQDVLTTASFNHLEAGGPAPQLLVDMVQRDTVARAEAAYAESERRQAAAATDRDAKMLPNL